MTVVVKCFAIARDLTGFAERAFELAEGATAGDALAAVVGVAPTLSTNAGRLALAVNLEYVDRSHVLKDGDEIALIPPVSGGFDSLSRCIQRERVGVRASVTTIATRRSPAP